MATKQGRLKRSKTSGFYYVIDKEGNKQTEFHTLPADAWDEFRKANGMSKITKQGKENNQ
jgi:hypothetical protein